MNQDYSVSTAYLKLMMQADPEQAQSVLSELNVDATEIFSTDFVSGQLINRIFETLERHGVQSFIVKHNQQLGVGSHGPLGFAALSAPNLKAALSTLVEFSSVRSSAYVNELRTKNNRLEFIMLDRSNHPLANRWLTEAGLLVAHKLIKTITAHPLGDLVKINFEHGKPDYAEQIDSIFDTNCQYNTHQNSLSLPASWGEIPSPLHDESVFRTNIAKCRELKLSLNKAQQKTDALVRMRILAHFEQAIAEPSYANCIPSVDSLADELFISPRSLIRKLAAHGTSYKLTLQEIRYQFAQDLLKGTHHTAAEIAIVLGYQEPANFGRAFKTWSGSSPAAWRRAN